MSNGTETNDLAEAWERGFMTAHSMDRGGSPNDSPEVPDHLVEDFKSWNPYRIARKGMTTETLTLTDFLLARIAEDETEARIAGGGEWQSWNRSWDSEPVRDLVADGVRSATLPMSIDEHICRHDPARVLAECKAKRAIVEGHKSLHVCANLIDDGYTDYSDDDRDDGYIACPTVRTLASIYAGHEDCRTEWVL